MVRDVVRDARSRFSSMRATRAARVERTVAEIRILLALPLRAPRCRRAEGMNDFRQIREVPEMEMALTSAAASGKVYPGGAVSVVTRDSSWKCKNGAGEVSGPVTTETLKVWWDYEQINETTLVVTEGMSAYAPVCEVPELFKALALADPGATAAAPASEPAKEHELWRQPSPPRHDQYHQAHPERNSAPDAHDRPNERGHRSTDARTTASALATAAAAEAAAREARSESLRRASSGLAANAIPQQQWQPPRTHTHSSPYLPFPASAPTSSLTPVVSRDHASAAFPEAAPAQSADIFASTPAQPWSAAMQRRHTEAASSTRPPPQSLLSSRAQSVAPAAALASIMKRQPPSQPQRSAPSQPNALGGAPRYLSLGARFDECGVDDEDDDDAVATNKVSRKVLFRGMRPDDVGAAAGVAQPLATAASSHSGVGVVKRAMSKAGTGVIGQIGQMYGALQEEMQSLESEYARLKTHLHEDYTRYFKTLETALAESEQKLRRAREQTRELKAQARAEEESIARQRHELEALAATADRTRADAERVAAADAAVKAREAEVSAREETLAAAGHELAAQRAAFERSRDEADKRWADADAQLAASTAALDSRAADLDAEYKRCVAAKDALREETERMELEGRRREALIAEGESRLDADIRAFEAARAEQQASLDEDRRKVREHVDALEKYKEMNKEMLEADRAALRNEREALRARLGEERDRAAARARREEDARAAASTTSPFDGEQRREQPFHHAAYAGVGVGGGSRVLSSASSLRYLNTPNPPMRAHAAYEVYSNGGSAPPAPASAAAAAAADAGAMLVPVFRGGQPEEGATRVGDVALTSDTTVGSLRAALQSQFQLPAGFQLRKRRVPIHPTQDHHAALDFFSDRSSAIVVD